MSAPAKPTNALRTIAAMVGLAFRAAPLRASLSLATEMTGAILTLVSAYQIKSVVQAASHGDARQAILSGALLAVTAGIGLISYLCYAQLSPRVMEAITIHVDTELIRLTARIPTLEYADRPAHADKISLIRGSSQQLAQGLQAISLNLRMLIQLGGAFVILISLDPWLSLLPLFAVPRALAGQRARRLQVAAQEASAEPMRLRGHIFNHATSPVAGKELRIFGLGGALSAKYDEISATTRHLNMRALWGGTLWSALGDLVFTLGCVAAIAWLVVRAGAGKVGPGDVVLAATMITGLILQMTYALQFAQFLQAIMTTVERYLWLVDLSNAAAQAPADAPPGKARPPARLGSGLKVEGVAFAYPDRETPVLTDISLELPAGRVVALVGENGSGKSTLVKLLCGFYRPSHGRILVDAVDLAEMALGDWRARVGGAFQDFTNFELMLLESVGVGDLPRLGDRALTTSALERAGGGDLALMPPSGLDTLLGKKWGGVDLSGGQWQKLALSRALIRASPLLVVFDEPAAALDASAEHDLFERFAAETRSGEAAGRATLLVSHRFSTVRMADAIAVLDGGRIVEWGPHDTLIRAGGKYAELYDLQASAYR